jgi:undecaprenyl-diphosphatase
VRLAIAIVVVAWCIVRARGVSGVERSVFEAVNSLPDGLHPMFGVLYRVGFLVAMGLVGAAAVIGRRWHLVRDLTLAGIGSAVTAVVLNHVVGEPVGAPSLFHLIRRWPAGPSFPSIRLALVIGVFAAAGPYLSRPTRRLLVIVAAGVAIATLYLGAGYPVDVLVGAIVGWGAAAAVHLVFRSPGGRPTAAQVTQSLLELGVRAHDVHLDPVQQAGFTRMVGTDDDGPLSIKVIGRDESDARLVAKLWRIVMYKDSGPRLSWTRLADVEHEAYMTLLASDGGVRAPRPLVAGRGGPSAALLVQRPIPGVPLNDLAPGLVTDELLQALWSQVGRLHAAHVVHGRLNGSHIVIGENGPAIIRFDHASTAGSAPAGREVAELLAVTAHLVDAERAVTAAADGIGRDAVRAALPWLQPAALSRETRANAGGRAHLHAQLARLREVAGWNSVGEVAPLEDLHRVRRSSLAMAAAALVAVIVLLTQIEAPTTLWHTLSAANLLWLALAFAASMTTNIAFAVGLQGTTRLRLPFWATTELQVATSFSNLLVPVIGGTAMQIRFLQRQGASLVTAVAAAGLIATAAAVAAQLPMFVLAALVTPDHLSLGDVSVAEGVELLVGIVVLLGIAGGVAFGVPRFRRLLLPSLHDGASTVAAVVRSPRQLGLLLVGNGGAAVLYCLCLFACLKAFGGAASVWTLLSLSIGVSALSGIIPIAGGGAAVSTIGISGALIAVGIDTDIAVATGIVNQLVVTYLPAIPGWVATRHLIARNYL